MLNGWRRALRKRFEVTLIQWHKKYIHGVATGLCHRPHLQLGEDSFSLHPLRP
jgi:hypothetical protein